MDALTELSPRGTARLYALFYLVTIVAGLTAQLGLSDGLISWSNAAQTASNIIEHASQFRLAFTMYMIEMTAQIATTLLLYSLLKVVNKRVAQVSAVINLVGCVIKIISRLFFYAPLYVLAGSAYLNVFSRDQLNALAVLLLRVNDQGAAMALLFFGFAVLLEGYLLLRSTFLPKFLGALSVISGLGWLTFLWPPLGYAAFNLVAPVALIGSLSMIGWMLVKGVNDERWRAQAALAHTSIWR